MVRRRIFSFFLFSNRCKCFVVIGQQEQKNGTINIRTRDNKQHGEFPIDEVIRRFHKLAASRTNHAEDEFAGLVDNDVPEAMARLALSATSYDEESANHEQGGQQ